MKTSKVKHLLDKYLEGNSTLEEESQLMEYFQDSNVPSEIEHYKEEFNFYTQLKLERPEKNLSENYFKYRNNDRRNLFHRRTWYQIAVSILLLITSFLAGRESKSKISNNEIIQLSSKLYEVQQEMVKIKIQQESAYQKIQGIVLASQVQQPFQHDLIHEIIPILLYDESPLVRNIALEFLIIHKNNPEVTEGLFNSILVENNPSIRREALNGISTMNNKLIKERLIKLTHSDSIPKEVKDDIIAIL